MKKILCILFVVVALFSLTRQEKTFLQVIKSPIDAKYTLYTNQAILPVASAANSIISGSLNIISCDVKDALQLYATNQANVLGQQIQFSCSSSDFYNYLKQLDCKIVFEESIGDIKSFYCYSKYLSEDILLSYGKVNLQVCYKEGCVIVGSPLIIGSY